MRIRMLGVVAGLGLAPAVWAQDSVSVVPGGNDALSAYSASGQRVRYAVDLVQGSTSWNNPILIGPIVKASRDVDSAYSTQILGGVAASPGLATGLTFASTSYSAWGAAGYGVSPTDNFAAGSVAVTGFASQFGVALSDFSSAASNVVGAKVGRVAGAFTRLYVERVIAACSRAGLGGADTATLSVGGVDALGGVALRADGFNVDPNTPGALEGDNIVLIDTPVRGGGVNTLRSETGLNVADDAMASSYVVNGETTPTNTPCVVEDPAYGPFALVFDFASRFRDGSSAADLTSTMAHLPAGVEGQRGNPTFSATHASGGSLGTVGCLAKPTGGSLVNELMAFGLESGGAGLPPVVATGTQRAVTLPSPISDGAFATNLSGNAFFNQYQSQTPWRGGNGPVGVGQDAAGGLVLAAVATDPADGDFIAVAALPPGNGAATWSVAAYAGKDVLNAPNGASVGVLASPAVVSAPAVDLLGNVYFVAAWEPTALPEQTGVFKAVRTASGYQLELLLQTGQSFHGANSNRDYTITSLTLRDADSLASGAMGGASVIQEQDPAATTSDAVNLRAFGGVVVSAVITYDNGGTNERYDALLYLGPTAGKDCVADYDNNTTINVSDIFAFLRGWFGHSPDADVNIDSQVNVRDIFAFLRAWFSHCA